MQNEQPPVPEEPRLTRRNAQGLWATHAWLGLSACFAACTPNAGSPRVSPPVTMSALMPGPAPRGRSASEASTLNASCTGCHAQIAAEWRESFHARSQRDEAYQRAFKLEPLPFCQGCHAPETSAFQPVPAQAADLGVGCVTCHLTDSHVLAVANAASPNTAPHALSRSAAFAGTSACSSCHEFAFPNRHGKPELMQATLTEHEHSDRRDTPCASCHMPNVGEGASRHRSHAFPGGHSPEFVKGALSVRAERSTDASVHFVLLAAGVGHAFPTGDLFRRLEVSLEAVGPDFQVVSSARRYLARHWVEERTGSVAQRHVASDDRPSNSALELDVTLEGAVTPLPVAWRIAYQRVEHPRSEAEQDSVLDGEIEIASGMLPPLWRGTEDHAHP
ncbi:MAG: multiheme c-type cytochrome [Pseudomonadota bacterium]